MGKYSLKMVSGLRNRRSELILEMIDKEKLPENIGYDVNKDRYIFADWPYSAELTGEDIEAVGNITFLVNGFPVSQTIRDGHIEFNDFRFQKDRIFMDNFGYVQISIIFSVNGKQQELVSRYVSVLVKKSLISESVQRMATFVYVHHEPFLHGKRMTSRSTKGLKEDAPQILDSKIRVLYTILETYKANYRFFKTNSKFRVRLEGRLVDFEKAQYFDNNTIQNITCNPAYLVPSMHYGGIRYQGTNYIPTKVYSRTNEINYDIYENQVVVGFLLSLKKEVSTMISEIEQRIEGVPSNKEIIDGYFASACFICDATKRQLESYQERLKAALFKLSELYILYQNLLQVSELPVIQQPRPSEIFLSIHHYRAIYDGMEEWFKYGIYDFAKEDFMLPFIQMHKLYEYYVLTKLCCHMEYAGFELESREGYAYKGHHASILPENFNTFYFTKGDTQVTIFYEPIINGKRNLGDNGIGLYRNTSIAFPKQWQIDRLLNEETNAAQSSHYCPDYVIKIHKKDRTDYIILDAKFSKIETVKGVYLPCLAYKYLFSVSPLGDTDHILGMCLVNGKSSETDDKIFDVYDLAEEGHQICPFASILTLTENSVENEELHQQLLNAVLFA